MSKRPAKPKKGLTTDEIIAMSRDEYLDYVVTMSDHDFFDHLTKQYEMMINFSRYHTPAHHHQLVCWMLLFAIGALLVCAARLSGFF